MARVRPASASAKPSAAAAPLRRGVRSSHGTAQPRPASAHANVGLVPSPWEHDDPLWSPAAGSKVQELDSAFGAAASMLPDEVVFARRSAEPSPADLERRTDALHSERAEYKRVMRSVTTRRRPQTASTRRPSHGSRSVRGSNRSNHGHLLNAARVLSDAHAGSGVPDELRLAARAFLGAQAGANGRTATQRTRHLARTPELHEHVHDCGVISEWLQDSVLSHTEQLLSLEAPVRQMAATPVAPLPDNDGVSGAKTDGIDAMDISSQINEAAPKVFRLYTAFVHEMARQVSVHCQHMPEALLKLWESVSRTFNLLLRVASIHRQRAAVIEQRIDDYRSRWKEEAGMCGRVPMSRLPGSPRSARVSLPSTDRRKAQASEIHELNYKLLVSEGKNEALKQHAELLEMENGNLRGLVNARLHDTIDDEGHDTDDGFGAVESEHKYVREFGAIARICTTVTRVIVGNSAQQTDSPPTSQGRGGSAGNEADVSIVKAECTSATVYVRTSMPAFVSSQGGRRYRPTLAPSVDVKLHKARNVIGSSEGSLACVHPVENASCLTVAVVLPAMDLLLNRVEAECDASLELVDSMGRKYTELWHDFQESHEARLGHASRWARVQDAKCTVLVCACPYIVMTHSTVPMGMYRRVFQQNRANRRNASAQTDGEFTQVVVREPPKLTWFTNPMRTPTPETVPGADSGMPVGFRRLMKSFPKVVPAVLIVVLPSGRLDLTLFATLQVTKPWPKKKLLRTIVQCYADFILWDSSSNCNVPGGHDPVRRMLLLHGWCEDAYLMAGMMLVGRCFGS